MKPLATIEVFGLKILSPEGYNLAYGWSVGSAFCPSAWSSDGRGLTTATEWTQSYDGVKMPDVSKAAKVGAAIGAAALSIVPGGAAIVAAVLPVVAVGLSALDAVQGAADSMLDKDSMYFPPSWWRPSWPLQICSAGRFVLISGQIPETTDEPPPAVATLDGSTRLEELCGPSSTWAIWLGAADAWATWGHDHATSLIAAHDAKMPTVVTKPTIMRARAR